jgi:tetratricopeptide (TPR) repeat protein
MTDDQDDTQIQDDWYRDGMWMADGLDSMFVNFVSGELFDSEWEEFLEDCQRDSSLKVEEEFISLPVNSDRLAWQSLFREVLLPRKLHLASAVFRHCREGTPFPRRLRIRRLPKDVMKDLLLREKNVGNQLFAEGKYEEAIESYDNALCVVWQFMVAPADQVKEVVNCLSNQAECYLRMAEYQDAGNAATCALMLDDEHAKSRFRRAKAAIAIAADGGIDPLSRLIQAQYDLEETIRILGNDSNATQEATETLQSVEKLLAKERKSWEKNHPGVNFDCAWDFFIRQFRSKCW